MTTASDAETTAVELPDDRFRRAVAISDWLLGEARSIRDPNIILEGLCMWLV